MNIDINIKACFHSCPFFGSNMDGVHCKHPHWDDKGVYESMIITQENSRGGNFPEKCPLRLEPLTVTKTYSLNNNIVVGDEVQFVSGNYAGLDGVVIETDFNSKDPRAIYGYLHKAKLSNGAIGYIEKSEHYRKYPKS